MIESQSRLLSSYIISNPNYVRENLQTETTEFASVYDSPEPRPVSHTIH